MLRRRCRHCSTRNSSEIPWRCKRTIATGITIVARKALFCESVSILFRNARTTERSFPSRNPGANRGPNHWQPIAVVLIPRLQAVPKAQRTRFALPCTSKCESRRLGSGARAYLRRFSVSFLATTGPRPMRPRQLFQETPNEQELPSWQVKNLGNRPRNAHKPARQPPSKAIGNPPSGVMSQAPVDSARENTRRPNHHRGPGFRHAARLSYPAITEDSEAAARLR